VLLYAARPPRAAEGYASDPGRIEEVRCVMTLRFFLEKLVRLVKSEQRRYRGLRGVGQEWERLAEKHLKEAGYRIRERNYRTRVGEIDFVAQDGDVLCFVEVKGRHGTGFGLPEEAVNAEKQRRIFLAAQTYLEREHLESAFCRFDVVSILQDDSVSNVTILRDAFVGPPRPRPPR
jgi:putative endonuclease